MQILKTSYQVYQEQILKLSQDQSLASKYRRWFHSTGKLFQTVDKQQSKDLAVDLKAELKQCHTNCTRAILFDFRNKYRYFEGEVMWRGIPIQHSFLLDQKGKVIDPTMGISEKIRIKKAKKYGIDLKNDPVTFGTEYFGVEISKTNVLKLVQDKRMKYLDLVYLYWEKNWLK